MKDTLGATRLGLKGAVQGAGWLFMSPAALALKPQVTLAQQGMGDVAEADGRGRQDPACQ